MQNISHLGIFLAFPYAEANTFYREGIIRHQFFVLRALLTKYKDLQLEIWSVDINAEYFEKMFLDYLGEFQTRMEFRNIPLFLKTSNNEANDENSFKLSWRKRLIGKIKQYPIGQYLRKYKKWLSSNSFFSKKITEFRYNYTSPEQRFIVDYINRHHRCDVMYFTYNWGLGTYLNMPKVLVVHDLHTITHAQLFANEIGYKQLEIDNAMLLQNIRNFVANSTELIVLCEYVKKSQLSHLLPEIADNKVNVIYTPITVSESKQILDKVALMQKYKLPLDLVYIFYPTQIRAQKNLSVVVKALHHLHQQYGIKLSLVNTGEPKQYPPFAKLLKTLNLSSYFIQLSSISDQDLYAFYSHALAGVAPSYTEGNFPLQAMEALAMHTPVALAKMPIILDRLQTLNNYYAKQTLDEFFFASDDAEQLAQIFLHIKQIGKSAAFAKQQSLLDELQKYTWEQAAESYYNVLQKSRQSQV